MSLVAKRCFLLAAFLTQVSWEAHAAYVVNPPMTIDRRLTVQVIQVADNAGANAAPVFGSAGSQVEILAGVDTIWAQAGIDVEFKFRTATYNSSFALNNNGNTAGTRPSNDLSLIINNASIAGGVLDADPKVLNLFMLRFVPGFPVLSDNSAAGLAFINGNGITMWSGPNLFGFAGGREVIAGVLAHELGHNLGLNHSGASENLMTSGGVGERLDLGEIATARSSGFLVVIPEPASALLLFVTATSLAATRRRR